MPGLPASARRAATWAAAALLGAVSPVAAQSQGPHIGYVCPAGGQQGDTFRIAVGGQQLSAVTDAHVTGEGVTLKVIELVRTLNRKRRAELQQYLAALQRARPTIDIVDTISEIRRQLSTQEPSSPAISDTVVVEVTVAPDAVLGRRELRLATRSELTNPLVFNVGALPEVTEGAVPETPFDTLVLRAFGEPVPLPEPQIGVPIDVTLPAVVNGQILPGSTDQYRFKARRGQKIIVVVEARKLIPYIADGVPGWFEAAASVRDANGRELTYADHFRFQPDPVLCIDIPADGEYLAEVRDSIYRGREDFVYRMILGELPFVTGIFPLGCKAGDRTAIEVMGWNLPTDRITHDTAALAPGVHLLSLFNKGGFFNSVPFAVDDAPEIAEARSHGLQANAQEVTLPAIINGRIDSPGQWDVFRFQASGGEEIVAQVDARRLGSPLDSVLMLMDAGGSQVAANDDHGSNWEAGLETHHADSYILARLPAAGTYYLHLGDIQQHGGPEYAYRLRLRSPRPDFKLRIAPSAINLKPGGNVPVEVYVLREDGFAGGIDLSMPDAPAGLILNGGRIGPAQDRAWVTLSARTRAPLGRIDLRLQGRAMLAGREVIREALPTEDMMQAFLWRHLVPAHNLSANVPPGAPPRRPISVTCDMPLEIPAGSSASIEVDVNVMAGVDAGPVQFELINAPDGISVQPTEPSQGVPRMVLTCDAEKIEPGFQGNLIAAAYVMVKPPPFRPQPPPPTAAELMEVLKELPPSPDKLPEEVTRGESDLDRLVDDIDESMEAGGMDGSSMDEPEPIPLVVPPPQKMPLGTLPAIAFEIVEP